MKSSKVKAIFNLKFNNQKNILTSRIIHYGNRQNLLYELSSGRDRNGNEMIGVTFLYLDDDQKPVRAPQGLNQLFTGHHALTEAKDHINKTASRYPNLTTARQLMCFLDS